MELGKDKLKYIVNYGIAPFFAERLKKEVSESDWLAVCYSESLKKIIQESEMDFKFCGTCKNKVQLRYWDLMFLGHETATNLMKKINDGLAGSATEATKWKLWGTALQGVQIFRVGLPQNV